MAPSTASPRNSNRSLEAGAAPAFSLRYEVWISACLVRSWLGSSTPRRVSSSSKFIIKTSAEHNPLLQVLELCCAGEAEAVHQQRRHHRPLAMGADQLAVISDGAHPGERLQHPLGEAQILH